MGLAIFYLIYLFFKIVGILFPLLCGTKINKSLDNKIANSSSRKINSLNENNNINPLTISSDTLKGKNDEENDNEGNENEEENQNKKNDSKNNDGVNESNDNEEGNQGKKLKVMKK